MALRHEKRCPEILLTCWSQVLETSENPVPPPAIRAFKSDDDKVWAIAPKWEGPNIRAFVAVDGRRHGDLLVRDIDRPLLTYTVKVPQRRASGWLESGVLLLVSN